ncbi:MAG: TatD family hydrolase [Atopobiaceae bacterium]|nr:TatD family hydrolase [Atopobiaceae bacterium]
MGDAAVGLFGFEGPHLVDAHVHLDFMANAREVAVDAASRGLCLFANTVTPDGYKRTIGLVGDLPNVRVGVGLHPRWVADGICGEDEIAGCVGLVPTTQWVGEVGLDFSARYTVGDARTRQLEAFESVVRACSDVGGRVLSIHAVRSASAVLDVLCETGCAERCTCIMHWFSGSTEELWRAIRAGCWFSVNERQARTRRAKEQLKLIPLERMLYETDLPAEEGETFSAGEVESSLLRAQELVRHWGVSAVAPSSGSGTIRSAP